MIISTEKIIFLQPNQIDNNDLIISQYILQIDLI